MSQTLDAEDTPAPAAEAITDLLHELRRQDSGAMARLFPLVYEELRRVAHRARAGEGPGQTLGTTGLVHEVYLRLVDQTRADYHDRAHFFAVAARAMRRILVDQARRRRALKRGGGQPTVSLELTADSLGADDRAAILTALDEALTRLATVDARLSQVVECRFFAGLTEEETAEAVGVTPRTVRRDWVKAKGWLYRELSA